MMQTQDLDPEGLRTLFSDAKTLVTDNLLKSPSTGVDMKLRRRREEAEFGGMRPQLGHSISSSNHEADNRAAWKLSGAMDKSLSMIQSGLQSILSKNTDRADYLKVVMQHYRFLVSFLLNVIDDDDLEVKIKGYEILQLLCTILLQAFPSKDLEMGTNRVAVETVKIFIQNNIISVFIEALQPGLYNYLPLNSSLSVQAHANSDLLTLLNQTYTVLNLLFRLQGFANHKLVNTNARPNSKNDYNTLVGENLLIQGVFRSLPLAINDTSKTDEGVVLQSENEFLPLETISCLLSHMETIILDLNEYTYLYLHKFVISLNSVISSPSIFFLNRKNTQRDVIVCQALTVYGLLIERLWLKIAMHRYDILGGLLLMIQLYYSMADVDSVSPEVMSLSKDIVQLLEVLSPGKPVDRIAECKKVVDSLERLDSYKKAQVCQSVRELLGVSE
ncbi:hypothetical protein BABINDRAFT_96222 [Babjeviella inositovora NRRL Y-12698]|uniref:Uncharacterized protein n=1 Tax=Babjeviella inositovora NRRL Y-12698 TaxID=984486 RepID=A0A1E3QIQ7_9ASCO|nr:uncharacterized protein BABINDRAFT_96222 [Babjeviella inositovora NRRL Y-12698]ODQ77586.1 hypothetical protein BABINDRAFT_96222 [Babjeviella inositovora NRRL Y-12698]